MLKVGKIEYLNTIPVYYGIVSGLVPKGNVEFYEGVPSELNELIRDGKLDISVVSSYEYLLNRDKYLLLPDLSISAFKKVFSVLFLSRLPIHQLHRKDVWLTRASMTSRALVEFMFKQRYGIEPNYHLYSMKEANLPKNPTALLSIGDEALKLLGSNEFPFIYDLAEEWFNMYGMPFVFAVWVTRKDTYKERPEEVKLFHLRLLKSRDIGVSSVEDICNRYGRCLGISQEMCQRYLSNLMFNLDDEKIRSLRIFSSLLNLGEKLEFIE
ncbi:MAG: hypothetical protein GWP10_22605 [Nitrospiraceae bacterium]|nr:hypothetical protein [Nitrospiraceae bacterium]